MARTKEQIERDIQWERQQLNNALEHYQTGLRQAHSVNTGNRFSTVMAQGMLEDSAKKFYDEETQRIYANISRLQAELETLPEFKREKLLSQKKSAQTEEEFRALAKEFRKINCLTEAKECETTALKMQYSRLVTAKNKAFAEEVYKNLANEFRSMNGYENSTELAKKCDDSAVKARCDAEKAQYNRLVATMNRASTEEEYRNLANELRSMNGYENTTELANECDKMAIKAQYNRLVATMNKASTEEEYKKLANEFRSMNGYENTTELANDCEVSAQKILDEKEKKYTQLLEDKERAEKKTGALDASVFRNLATRFWELKGYKSASVLSGECNKIASSEEEKNHKYDTTLKELKLLENQQSRTVDDFRNMSQAYKEIGKKFKALLDYKDSENYATQCETRVSECEQKIINIPRRKKIIRFSVVTAIVILALGFCLYQGWFAFAFNRSITIPESVTIIGDSEFAGKQLTSVVIPESVTSIGKNAFSRNGLTSITIGANVTLGSNAFGSSFEDFYRDNGMVAGTYKKTNIWENILILRDISSKLKSEKETGAYRRCNDISKEWSVWHGNFRFQNDDGNIIITGYDGIDNMVEIPAEISGYPVTAIANAEFENPPRKINGSPVRYISEQKFGVFENKNLTSVSIPSSIISIGERAFSNNQLTNVSIPNSVTSIENSAFSNNQLISVSIGNSVTSIGDFAFCRNQLTNVSIPRSVTSIGNSAFSNNQLASVSIPNSVTSIGSSVFSDNQQTSVSIGNGITSIESSAFSRNQLTNVIIPKNVTSIGAGAFSRNYLTNVIIPNSVTFIGVSAFSDNQIASITIGANVELGKNEYRKHGQGGGPLIKNGVLGSDVSFNDVYAQNGSKAGTYTYNNNSGWTR